VESQQTTREDGTVATQRERRREREKESHENTEISGARPNDLGPSSRLSQRPQPLGREPEVRAASAMIQGDRCRGQARLFQSEMLGAGHWASPFRLLQLCSRGQSLWASGSYVRRKAEWERVVDMLACAWHYARSGVDKAFPGHLTYLSTIHTAISARPLASV
jgi:hypothetical protein